jgi:geranylgeranyl pyrophosphate synthase
MLFEYVTDLWSQSSTSAIYLAELKEHCLPEAADVVRRDPSSLLPIFFCRAFGGDERQVEPLLVTWGLLRRTARILDDIVDCDLDGQGDKWRVDLNASIGLFATATIVLNRLEQFGIPSETARAIRHTFFSGILQTAGGQHLTLVDQQPTLADCWQAVEAKTGNPMGLLCWAGARLATDDERQLAICHRFGFHIGILDQIRDDLTDLWSAAGTINDLSFCHSWTLPVAYAMSVLPESDKQQLFLNLSRAASNNQAEEVARQSVVESGAGIYLMVQAILHRQKAGEQIAEMNFSGDDKTELISILDSLYPASVK